MPELPEVEVVRRGLERWVSGRVIERARVLDPRSARRHLDGPRDLELGLQGARVDRVARRGKFLWLPLTLPDAGADAALLAHLGMSGQLLMEETEAPLEKHAKVILDLSPQAGAPSQLRFIDQRIFGGLWMSPLTQTHDGAAAGMGEPRALLPVDAAHIARDVLDPLVTAATLHAAWHGKRTAIKAAILDQSLLSGVGNIYADEALWRTKLHYLTPAGSLSLARARELLQALRDVMTDALAAGGTSFDSLYVDVNGASGYFDRSLNAYGREGEACGRCADNGRTSVMLREKWGGRSSFRCPWCQRVPRGATQRQASSTHVGTHAHHAASNVSAPPTAAPHGPASPAVPPAAEGA